METWILPVALNYPMGTRLHILCSFENIVRCHFGEWMAEKTHGADLCSFFFKIFPYGNEAQPAPQVILANQNTDADYSFIMIER